MRKIFAFVFVCFFFFMINSEKVEGYETVCNGDTIFSSQNKLQVCDENVYLMKNDVKNSSFLRGKIDFKYYQGKLLYAGKIDGIETFYSSGFNFYGVVYDNNGLFKREDAYSDLSIDGEILYNGAFDDNVFVDQSYNRFVGYFNEIGEYKIRQFVNGKIHNVIRVVVNRFDYDINVDSVKYGDNSINEKNLVFGKDKKLSFYFTGGKYGFGKDVSLSINGCAKKVMFFNPLIIDEGILSSCLKLNENNSIKLTVSNGLDESQTFKYDFKIVTGSVSIKLENSVSKIVTTSRRIVIDANAGIGNELDKSNCLYYWSKNANDKLNYNDFMVNYNNSDNKGSYSGNNAVILRDSSGTYYLYALAKDSSGDTIVVRSDEYVLEKAKMVKKVTNSDVLLVIGFCVVSAIPIFVYLFIRVKDSM